MDKNLYRTSSIPRTACILLTFIVLVTCGKDSPTNPKPVNPPKPPPTTPPTQPPPARIPSRLTISPSSILFTAVGQTKQLTVKVYDQNNATMSDFPIIWSDTGWGVVSVNATGLVRALRSGVDRITARARSSDVSASIEATVSQTPVAMRIAPAETTLTAIGDTTRIVATVEDENGQPVVGAPVTWASSDEAVVTVNDQGRVTAIDNGMVRIAARSGDFSGNANVTVSQAVHHIEIEPGRDDRFSCLVKAYN